MEPKVVVNPTGVAIHFLRIAKRFQCFLVAVRCFVQNGYAQQGRRQAVAVE